MSERTTAREFTAQMSIRESRWRLYVVLLNTCERWPEHPFGHAVPTFTDRTDALSVLGFEPVPGAEWTWTEYSETPDDPSSPVGLIGAIRVRSWSEVSV
ncbi:DUF6303 family protein [Streptomyces turgidiscabies]|uniref:Uncharacterized protein n=1 Tax=Streptomyces turgidiscabies (strain Car8) TaxID=698760 RepID=L7FHT3_STRT8|nr:MULTISPECIES: DUF6303 family protein [Streptomyces]ELP70958.1 hypothetical protein STRTUCAR8_05848 [Streptomyces turgidiscabies Car8]MDX3499445.1 DUF6303 family protein [Streptomyces turgidiscabies]GAQ77088.1 hypothetical protein T45_08904 [Streptomyces turgidiscabies]